VILTNGPGEVAAWVKPVVTALRQHTNKHFSDIRISVVLAPCPHASGGELQLLQTFDEIDRCQGPEGFWQLLLLGRSLQNWDWRKQGLCIFLGGDQFNALVLGYRLGYRTLVYTEDAVRWPGFVQEVLYSTLFTSDAAVAFGHFKSWGKPCNLKLAFFHGKSFPHMLCSNAATCASLLCMPFLLLVTIMLCSLLSLSSSVAASALNPMTAVSAVL
jgi:hypothetical protein